MLRLIDWLIDWWFWEDNQLKSFLFFLPVNYLIIEALERYDFFFGPNFKVECPTGSGNMMRLKDCAKEISTRLASIFLPDENGVRPCHADNLLYKDDPAFKDLVLFYEYFHGTLDVDAELGMYDQIFYRMSFSFQDIYFHSNRESK